MTSMANWKEKAPDNFYACCTAALRVGNEKPEEFARSWLPLSPLWWRVMIFTWTAAITTWSLISFWGPREMFLLYMTHWGLVMILLESLFVAGKKMNYAPNPVLDIMLHGVNSGMMLIELVLSSHPSRVLHVMQPLYFSGTLAMLTITALFFALMHLITVGIATARDAIVDKYNSRNNVKYNDAFEP
ncbi:unnamed protein product, partial [Leptidea sinapis]